MSWNQPMREQRMHWVPRGTMVALVGNPNCGKTALFNRLTGSRQKVANYAGATVEKKEGRLALPDGTALRLLDLPGVYSLYPRSDDERVACDVLMGNSPGEKRPDALVCVVDATNLRRGLRLVLAVRRLGLPCLVVLNMADLAAGRGLKIDPAALSRALGLPVVTSVAVHTGGDAAVREWLASRPWVDGGAVHLADEGSGAQAASTEADHVQVQTLLRDLHLDSLVPDALSDRIDRVVLHPWAGPVILLAVLFLVFQAVFAWATWPMDQIKAGTDMLSAAALQALPEAWWRDLLVQGLLAGMGGVLVFLPQILILFFFILMLEESGYLPRAAFLLDRVMGGEIGEILDGLALAADQVVTARVTRYSASGFTNQAELDAAVAQAGPKSLVVVSTKQLALLLIALEDDIRAESIGAIAELEALEVEPVLMSGDATARVAAVAQQLAITNYFAEVTPEQKLSKINQIKADGSVTAMVGDGLNDVAALAGADVGIAMGSGTHAAQSAAAITIIDDNPQAIAYALQLSRRTWANIKQNLGWAFGYNVILIPVAAFGLLNPMLAGTAMAFSSLSVVLNALRLRFKK